METRIEKKADSSLLAELNKDVQELHVRKYPDLFKPCDNSAVRQFFDSLVQQPHWFHFVEYRGDVRVGFIQVERRELKDHPFRGTESSCTYTRSVYATSTQERVTAGN